MFCNKLKVVAVVAMVPPFTDKLLAKVTTPVTLSVEFKLVVPETLNSLFATKA